jgi:uncharacterized protein (DUF1778 family)
VPGVGNEKEVHTMAKESPSPVSFRLSPEDRQRVETVAAYRNQTVSDFLRTVVLEAADEIIRTEGQDKILRVLEEHSTRMDRERQDLYRRAIQKSVHGS